jgi:carbonic anhydrase
MKAHQLLAIITTLSLTGCATSVVQTKQTQSSITPEHAITELREGNARFASGKSRHRDLVAQSKKSATGQYPFAAVLGCIDSRASNEIVFDQGIGDIFSARVAGNVLNDDMLGSLEFATAKAGAKAILVLGHTRCGAVGGACGNVHLGHVTGLVEKIKPAVRKAKLDGQAQASGPAFEDLVSAENVKLVVSQIRSKSSLIRDLEKQHKLVVRGALYHLDTGKVEFFE